MINSFYFFIFVSHVFIFFIFFFIMKQYLNITKKNYFLEIKCYVDDIDDFYVI
jgi:hypothetical protein